MVTSLMMDERTLRYFLAVVRSGSIRGAAETLNVAASAVSRHVVDLEARCGLPLIERLPRGVIPTEAGKALAAHAQQVAEDAEQLSDYLQRLRGFQRGRVRLCCGEGFVSHLVGNGLPPFMKGHPDISVQVTVTGTNQVLASVANGEADIGLAYNPAQYAGVRSVVVSRQPLCAIVHPAHPFADRPGLALRDLAEESVAFLPSTHGVRQLIGRVEADQGFRLAPRMESGSVDVLCRYVLAAMGMTVLPCFAVAEYLASRRLSAIPLSDGLLGEACTHLLVRAYRRLPAPVERLVSILSTQVPAFKADGFRQMLPGEQRAFSKLLL